MRKLIMLVLVCACATEVEPKTTFDGVGFSVAFAQFDSPHDLGPNPSRAVQDRKLMLDSALVRGLMLGYDSTSSIWENQSRLVEEGILMEEYGCAAHAVCWPHPWLACMTGRPGDGQIGCQCVWPPFCHNPQEGAEGSTCP